MAQTYKPQSMFAVSLFALKMKTAIFLKHWQTDITAWCHSLKMNIKLTSNAMKAQKCVIRILQLTKAVYLDVEWIDEFLECVQSYLFCFYSQHV
jgi:hypothetical protein